MTIKDISTTELTMRLQYTIELYQLGNEIKATKQEQHDLRTLIIAIEKELAERGIVVRKIYLN